MTEALDQQASGSDVALTFDDGCETDLLAAAPLLHELGFSATSYVIAGRIGDRGYMSSSQLHELCGLGFEVGSHSLTHAFLSELPRTALQDELSGSKARLEDVLGRPVLHLSCPGGRYNRTVLEEAQRAGYRSVATSHPGRNPGWPRKLRIARVAVLRETSQYEFTRICRGQALAHRRIRYLALSAARRVLGTRPYEAIRRCVLARSHALGRAPANTLTGPE